MKGIYLILLTVVYSCSTSKTALIEKDKRDWIEAYKSTAFISCLQESYGKNFKSFLANDQSISANYEIIDEGQANKAKQNGALFAMNKISEFPKDSDFSGKKNVINSCLFYYKSMELDSIAKDEYNTYLKKVE